MSESFTHLHCHSTYSALDGAAKVKELVQAAVDDGMPALAVTDHGNMSGVVEFYKECKKKGIKFIPGIEFYVAKDSIEDRPTQNRKKSQDDGGGEDETGEKMYYHMTALAENNIGYRNLMQMSSRSFLEGFHRKPRIDWDIMSHHSKGVIVTTGCLGGLVLQDLMKNDVKGATEKAARLQDIFGKDNLFVELQDHGIPEQKRTNPMLIELAKRIDAPLLAAQDSHYVHAKDALAHDALLCVQTGAKIEQEDRFRFDGDQHYFKTAAEMRELFSELPEACDNTLWIADRSNVEIEFGKIRLPHFPVPERYNSADDYLRALVHGGAKKRWGFLTVEQSQRISYELSVIEQMGFAPYFLVVWDLTRFAREQNIRLGPGRGSAAGAAVSYCLGITQLDPLKYNLLFERFLNPERVSMPDIDLDIGPGDRETMINYCSDKYGADHVAQIITFGVIKARSAVRDASRVMGYPFEFGNKLSDAMPKPLFGRTAPIASCLNRDPKWDDFYDDAQGLRDLYATDPEAQKVIDVAMGLEDLVRSDGIHAAAVVIADEPITNIVPVQRRPAKKKGDTSPIVTQYEMHAIEDLGLLKMDFLGLRNLDVITDCLKYMEDSGKRIDLERVPLDDPATFDLIRSGHTIGLFQIEGSEMRDLLIRIQPTRFEDIAAAVALYRPGPMAANMHYDYADRKNGRQDAVPFHPDAADILRPTYQLCIYQEQLQEIAQKFAGYTLGEGYLLVKICAKKLPDEMAKEKAKFIDGCLATGYDQKFADDLFKMVEAFAHYAFNLSHSVSYGFVAYQTAYLKANYPAEYMAALIDSVRDDRSRSGQYIAEARRMGLNILCPDVNESNTFTKADTASQSIRIGLTGLASVGDKLAHAIVLERLSGPYGSIQDFVMRNLDNNFTKRSFVPLTQAGGFDSFGYPRKGILDAQEAIFKAAKKNKKQQTKGVMTLFDVKEFFEYTEVPIPNIEYSESEKLDAEQEAIGLFISGHPLDPYQDWLKTRVTHKFDELESVAQFGLATIPGLVRSVKDIRTRKGDKMSVAVVDDGASEAEIIIFPKTYKKMGHLVKPGTKGAFTCKVSDDNRGGDYTRKVVALEKIELVPVLESKTQTDGEYKIYLPHEKAQDDTTISKLKGLLLGHRGTKQVKLYTSMSTFLTLPDEYNVKDTQLLKSQLKKLFANTDR